MLRVTRSVLSGSTVLHMLDLERASTWAPGDLDIYAPIHHAARVVAYLISAEGYTVDHTNAFYYSPDGVGLQSVVHLRRGDTHIDVIQSATRSSLHPIPHFWASHLINYVTADSFCMAYPELTLSGRSVINPAALDGFLFPRQRTLQVIDKYSSRGYSIRVRP
ncbi:hypothetical protein FKP32DRAFT_1543326, partial [Trametes sanguinea]